MKNYFTLFFILIYNINSLNKPSKEYTDLVNWINKNGGYVSPKLYPIEEDNYNRYIITKEKILKNETILIIPDSIILSSMNGKISNICRNAYALEFDNYDYECLIYFMTLDRNNKKSFFYPYYNYFPKLNKKNFFSFLPNNIKEKISKTELGKKIKQGETFFKRSLLPVEKILKEKNLIEQYKENFVLVTSRNFLRRDSSFEDVNSMVPYVDLLNHKNNYNVYFYFDDYKDSMIVYAIKDINKGDEVINYYGEENNINLYTGYGFIIKDNIYKVKVHFTLFNEYLTFEYTDNIEKDVLNKINRFTSKKIFNYKDSVKVLYEKLNKEFNYYNNIHTGDENIDFIINEEKHLIEMYMNVVKKFNH